MKDLAYQMREAFDAVSPYIEGYTSEVCPTCERVCCIDRHGTHEELDYVFIRSLGELPPPEPPKEDDTEPCRHLGAMGCSIERWRRPYRCTWYFCQALLEEMPSKNPKRYREFMGKLQRLQELRGEIASR